MLPDMAMSIRKRCVLGLFIEQHLVNGLNQGNTKRLFHLAGKEGIGLPDVIKMLKAEIGRIAAVLALPTDVAVITVLTRHGTEIENHRGNVTLFWRELIPEVFKESRGFRSIG